MKRYWYIIRLLLLAIILLCLFIFILLHFSKTNENTNIDNNQNYIEEWHTVAESKNYKIFSGKVMSKTTTLVLDKNSNTLLTPDETCEQKINRSHKDSEKSMFYNNSIGIRIIGPYKNINYIEGSEDAFTQTFLNAGCIAQEGEIVLIKSEKNNIVSCQINIEYIPLSC